ncbi:hypothetical protein HD601_004795 [Jiangella mangrovi]|uniref:Uncharacterized protein n=1 Tax=Jiangella mangrovi TaxID=1524084 RepID=A0A7W9GUD7_9ACTN|nr:hypothetical protein [Jiangella mangrovi]
MQLRGQDDHARSIRVRRRPQPTMGRTISGPSTR